MPVYLIGVDVGTQGTKTCLFGADGALIASAFEPSRLITPSPGAMEQDPEEMLQSVVRTIREVVATSGARPGDIAAIGMDGQMAGVLGIDRDGNAVTPYDSWLDTRCEPQIAEMRRIAGDDVLRVTGAPVTYAHGPKVLRWKEIYPDIYARVAKFVLPVPFIVSKLCGLTADEAYIDSTCLHFSGFGDVQGLRFSPELLTLFGVDASKMPRVVLPGERVGSLTEAAAHACGLAPGTPVCAGAGDQAATALGAGIVREGLAFDVAGTASVFSVCTAQFAPDTEHQTLLYARSPLPGLWIPLAYIGGGGLCIRWLRDTLAAGDPSIDYARLESEAREIAPGSEGLLFVPHFTGRVCPNDPWVRGSFLGLGYRHTRGHMYRAVMESIAYEYALYSRILSRSTGETPRELYGIGGGSNSALFCQIKADALGVRYTRLDTADTGSWGSALLAGAAVGLYADLAAEAARHVRKRESFDPNWDNHERYQLTLPAYEQALTALRSVYHLL